MELYLNLHIECPYIHTRQVSKAGGPSKARRVHSISDTTFPVMHQHSVIKVFKRNVLPPALTNGSVSTAATSHTNMSYTNENSPGGLAKVLENGHTTEKLAGTT